MRQRRIVALCHIKRCCWWRLTAAGHDRDVMSSSSSSPIPASSSSSSAAEDFVHSISRYLDTPSHRERVRRLGIKMAASGQLAFDDDVDGAGAGEDVIQQSRDSFTEQQQQQPEQEQQFVVSVDRNGRVRRSSTCASSSASGVRGGAEVVGAGGGRSSSAEVEMRPRRSSVTIDLSRLVYRQVSLICREMLKCHLRINYLTPEL